MKSKKSKKSKIVQKTNIKINIGSNSKSKRKRRVRSKTLPPQKPYYHLPMYTVQHGSNAVNKDDFTNLIKQSNKLSSKRLADLLREQENKITTQLTSQEDKLTAQLNNQKKAITSKITKIEEMKSPDFKIPPEYLKLSDLQRFYLNFKENELQKLIRNNIESEYKPVINLPDTEDINESVDKPVREEPEIESKPRADESTFKPLEEEDIFKKLLEYREDQSSLTENPDDTSSNKKKITKMTKQESAAKARAAKSAKIQERKNKK
jgi:hypothetical protein